MAVRTETKNVYTCDRCDDTWDNTNTPEMEKSSDVYVIAIGHQPMHPRQLCLMCTKELTEWLTTPPQMKPSDMGDLNIAADHARCGNCKFYVKPTPNQGVCEKSLQEMTENSWCNLFEAKT